MKLNFQITAILLLNTPTIVKAHCRLPTGSKHQIDTNL